MSRYLNEDPKQKSQEKQHMRKLHLADLANRFAVVVDAFLLAKKNSGEQGLTPKDIIMLQNKFYLFSQFFSESQRQYMIEEAQKEIEKLK